MKWLLVFLGALVAALVGVWLIQDTGYVLIRLRGWALETNVIIFVAGLVLAWLTIHVAVYLWNLPGNAARKWVEKRSRAQLELGMLALAEGNWTKAEKALSRSARHSKVPAVSYLAAAQAAHGPGAEERREQYLEKAEAEVDARQSVLVTRAQLQLAGGDPETALATIRQLSAPHQRPRALEIMARALEELGHWDELSNIAADLVRNGIIDQPQAQAIEARAVAERLQGADTFAALTSRWQALPRPTRRQPRVLSQYADRAMSLGHGEEVEESLRRALSRDFDAELMRIYGRIEGGDVAKRLKFVESLNQDRPGNGQIQLALGRLSLQSEIWGKARGHLKEALDAGMHEAALELARLHEQLGETDSALQYYRQYTSRKTASDD